jgi:hypothetical protein
MTAREREISTIAEIRLAKNAHGQRIFKGRVLSAGPDRQISRMNGEFFCDRQISAGADDPAKAPSDYA